MFLMLALKEIAAIIGVIEVGFRGICFLHEYFRDLENVLMEIEAIWWETLAPLAVLSGVKFSPVL
jgi:hypothetical protein